MTMTHIILYIIIFNWFRGLRVDRYDLWLPKVGSRSGGDGGGMERSYSIHLFFCQHLAPNNLQLKTNRGIIDPAPGMAGFTYT